MRMSVVYHSQKEMLKIIVFAVFMMFYVKAHLLISRFTSDRLLKMPKIHFLPKKCENWFQPKVRYRQIHLGHRNIRREFQGKNMISAWVIDVVRSKFEGLGRPYFSKFCVFCIGRDML